MNSKSHQEQMVNSRSAGNGGERTTCCMGWKREGREKATSGISFRKDSGYGGKTGEATRVFVLSQCKPKTLLDVSDMLAVKRGSDLTTWK